jgi:SMI1 / KNR4 family (SUKH-1)
MSIIQETIQAWRRNGVEMNPGASAHDLQALRELFQCEVPADIREFYANANGMCTDVYDEHEVSFWSISKICAQRDAVADMEIGFADFLIESWRFMFRIEGNSVIVVSGNVSPGSPTENLGTFSDFLKLYVTSPDALRIL